MHIFFFTLGLTILGQDIGPAGAIALALALETNGTITQLFLSSNFFGFFLILFQIFRFLES
jgi:hypothetical protein